MAVPPHPVLHHWYRDEAERRQRVNALFDASAGQYDGINRMMSLGSGRRYRRQALLRAGLIAGQRHLDVGAGTGVIALLGQDIVGPSGEVVALDPSPGMLEVARVAGVRQPVPGRAEALPFPDAGFDLLTMGYALRHVTDLDATFTEFLRVLRPGAKVLILEITRPPPGLGYHALRFYLRSLVPLLTRLQGSHEAQTLMRYHWDTIEHCVPPATIIAALQTAGFEQIRRDVVLGLFSEYSGVRPSAQPQS
ncbi:class I SAM-dependent methyltransferase [Panacagrimonas sp.]|uniref:class I SAM-dependent methyltransferase n=1 Tax=Panacagrimonas sp. TaxID=2480088 RepID=UPI003B51ECC0